MNEKSMADIEMADFDIIENTLVALREIWKKKLLVILITIAGVLFALICVSIRGNSERFYSSATLFSAVYGSYSDTNEGVAVMNRYSDLISSSRVCNRAAQALTQYNITSTDLQDMVSNDEIRISGANTSSSSYGYKVTISAYSDTPDSVLAIANAMASAFAAELNDLLGSNAIQVMDEAVSYGRFETTNVKMYMLVIPAAAFVLTCAVIFVLSFFSPWVQSVSQCEKNDELVLGLLPYVRNK